MRATLQQALIYSADGQIGGGRDEILKNIIAEPILGLPADIRVDKEAALKNMPTGRETEALALRARGQEARSTST
jgi:hypothetical protein